MVYRAIGLMSGSSLDGLDIVFAELHEDRGAWQFEIIKGDCYPYAQEWTNRLRDATALNAQDYLLLHAAYGHYLGAEVNRFIESNSLHYKVGLIASHGHTTFHLPAQKMTAQLGDGAAIAAVTSLPVVSDLRALDVAFGGQGAPIVPIGEKLLFPNYSLFLNIGGIANISFAHPQGYIAFDICAANRVLNMLAENEGKKYDEGGAMARGGSVHERALQQLNELPYYTQPYPKSLANSFGIEEVFPLLQSFGLSTADALCTYTTHVAQQVATAVSQMTLKDEDLGGKRMMVTGGGAFNSFLIEQLTAALGPLGILVEVPQREIVEYKEALVMALIGVLRWRQEYNVFSSVTGAARDSIGGAIWNGQEA